MLLPILSLAGASFVIAWALTYAMIRIAPRIGFVDKPGHRKIHHNPKPLGGGVAMFWAIAGPMVAGLLVVNLAGGWVIERFADRKDVAALVAGGERQTKLSVAFLGAMAILHAVGIVDDRKAMGPYSKLLVQLGAAAFIVVGFDMRAMTFLGTWPSTIVTVLWITAITNAFNFLDNMDGLSAGVGALTAAAFLVAAVMIGQWFVAATLALLLGALLGFLCWNFPPARIFMGDSGSLLIGFVLGVLTVRTQFLPAGQDFGAGWYAVFAPVVVLAVPLYDLIVVSVIRLARGKSPFHGDTNHFSHRLVARGMSRRTAVLCIYLVTAATSVAAIVLPHVRSTFLAVLIFAQTLLILGVVLLLEQHPLPVTQAAPVAPTPPAEATPVPSAARGERSRTGTELG